MNEHTPRPARLYPEDVGTTPEVIATRRDARRVAHRAAQAAYGRTLRHELAMARAKSPVRGLPGEREPGALGALTEAYHRRYDVDHPGACRGCASSALRLLAFLPDPWRLTDDPDVSGRDAYTWTRHGLDDDMVRLLPTPWRLVADRTVPRFVLDEERARRLLWSERSSMTGPDLESRDAPGEPADHIEAQAQALEALMSASRLGRQPDPTREGPTMTTRQFVRRLWSQARRGRYAIKDDPFLLELRTQLEALRDNPHGDRRR